MAAKAAARVGPEAFQALHRRLLQAYFSENRDITSTAVLRELWDELRLPAEGFPRQDSPELLREVLSEHNEALERGATGVPAVALDGHPGVLMGAHPEDTYRAWIAKASSL